MRPAAAGRHGSGPWGRRRARERAGGGAEGWWPRGCGAWWSRRAAHVAHLVGERLPQPLVRVEHLAEEAKAAQEEEVVEEVMEEVVAQEELVLVVTVEQGVAGVLAAV